MDNEYKEAMYGALFDELDRVQANKLYTDPLLQKVALNIGGIARGIGRGAKSLAKDPEQFAKRIGKSYNTGANMRFRSGPGGVMQGVKRVLGTDEGKALAAGAVALGGAGGLMLGRRRQPQVVVNN